MNHIFGVTGTIGLTKEGNHVNLNIVSDDETSNVYLTAKQCMDLAEKLQKLAAQIERTTKETQS